MGSMSDIRKDIMARLGAIDSIGDRPGAKVTMAVNVQRGIDIKKRERFNLMNGTWSGGTWTAEVSLEFNESSTIQQYPLITELSIFENKKGTTVPIVVYKRGWQIKPRTSAEKTAYAEIATVVNKAARNAQSEWTTVWSRPGAKAKMGKRPADRFGLLDRLGAGYSAMTASPVDADSPGYKTALAAAKKEAGQVVGNYKFMRDKVAARQQSMDKYVQAAIKAINASSNVNDVQHFIEQLQIAVRAMSTILSSVKTPFARPGAKSSVAITADHPDKRKWLQAINAELKVLKEAIESTPDNRDDAHGSYHTYRRWFLSLKALHNMVKEGKRQWALDSWKNLDEDSRKNLRRAVPSLVDWLQGRTKNSRPGAKATFEDVSAEVKTLLDAAQKAIKRRDRSKAATALMKLRELLKARKLSSSDKLMLRMLEADADDAGLFSRPGAKAKMAKWTVVMPSIPDAGTRHFDSWEQAKKYVDTKMGGFTALVSVDGKRYALKHALGQWEKFSRPGAKVKAGRAEDLYRKLSSGSITYANAKEWERLVTEALRLPDYTPPGGDMSLHEIAEDLGGDLMALKTHSGPVPHAKAKAEKASDLEREDVKAGLKVMAASDPAVSDKIRTLIAEGKPQDQAVAIALDMKRRGEL